MKTLLIAFEPTDFPLGGLGDRLVGLMAVRLMAQALSCRFSILWTKENIRPYMDYSAHDFEQCTQARQPPDSCHVLRAIDQQDAMKRYLMESPEAELFPHTITKLYLNQEISQYLYKRLHKDNHAADLLSCYRSLFTEVLKPTSALLTTVDLCMNKGTGPVVGIQIRAGDSHMQLNCSTTHTVLPHTTLLRSILVNIKQHADARHPGGYRVFVTSDHDAIHDEACSVWSPHRILYCHEPIEHLDKTNALHAKLFADLYMLSQCTETLYVSDYSNYGRAAALTCLHTQIFNTLCHPVDLCLLFSKHDGGHPGEVPTHGMGTRAGAQ